MNPKDVNEILDRVRTWPMELQVNLAEVAESIEARHAEPDEIDGEICSAVLDGLAQAGRGEFASNEKVEAAFASFRRE